MTPIAISRRDHPRQNGRPGVWQTGGLPPGLYSLRLRVVKNDGNYAEFFAPNLSLNSGRRANAGADLQRTDAHAHPDRHLHARAAAHARRRSGRPAGAAAHAHRASRRRRPAAVQAAAGGQRRRGRRRGGDRCALATWGRLPTTPRRSPARQPHARAGRGAVALHAARPFPQRHALQRCSAAGRGRLVRGKKLFDWVWTQFR